MYDICICKTLMTIYDSMR